MRFGEIMERTLILASASPRRRELMSQIGLEFVISVAKINEQRLPNESPTEMVKRLAFEKAVAVFEPNSVVVAADTIVSVDDTVLGKPKDENEAKEMLKRLQGRQHYVYSGFCVHDGEKTVSEVVATEVVFRLVSDEEISEYVASGEPMDKAGAYGIQGGAAKFVSEIHGDYYNVVGLPICRLSTVLNDVFGWK